MKHLPGQQNLRADALRRMKSTYKWMLHPKLFEILNKKWGPFNVDRFASMSTRQMEKYNSYYLDPYTAGVDALAQKWKGQKNCVNSPFALIGKVLRKVEKEKWQATLIAPRWPGQQWYPLLRKMLRDYPIRLPSQSFLKVSANPEVSKNRWWKTYDWKISGEENYKNNSGMMRRLNIF